MPNVKIEDLENIVLEGGGAKGVAYAGAIRGIQKELADYYAQHTGEIAPKGEAILDYLKLVDGKEAPRIARFAGSSAGAITSFALALGFNATHIDDVLGYPFKNFLQDTHIGKYRMLRLDEKICVGEDRRSFLGRGDGTVEYVFELNKTHKVRESFFKAQFRKMVLAAAANAIIAGLLDTMPSIKTIAEKVDAATSGKAAFSPDDLPVNKLPLVLYVVKFILGLFGWGSQSGPGSLPQVLASGAPKASKPALVQLWWTRGAGAAMSLLLKKAGSGGMNIGMDAIGNVLWDRGMFSGFAVREFFFDVMLYACIHDTHFQRCHFPNEQDREALLKVKMDMGKGRLGTDFSGLNAGIRQKLRELPYLTFEEFYAVTGISLTLCVSNFTTDEPCYFSEYWTPNMPVMEAVGASMSIPPAIKPVFNERDVKFQDPNDRPNYHFDYTRPKWNVGPTGDCFDFGQFSTDLVAIKKVLARDSGLAIDSNNPLSVSGHLTLLRKFLEKEANKGFKAEVDLGEGETVAVSYATMLYHYNCAYKGLLLDGGYRCNIPYNILRAEMANAAGETVITDVSLDHTLAIKLDNSFPKEMVRAWYKSMEAAVTELGPARVFRRQKRHRFGSILKRSYKGLCHAVNEETHHKIFALEDEPYLSEDAFEHIADTIIDLYEEMTTRHATPWNRSKSITGLASEGYSYGSESGQIRYLTDHERIIPLYSYGVGTYDFDVKAIGALVDFAKTKAEARVRAYFAPSSA